MKCGTKGIDTAPEIIFEGCNMFYVPNETEDEPRKLHKKYMEDNNT